MTKLFCRLLLLSHQRVNRRHAFSLPGKINLNIGAGASEPNHQAILRRLALNPLTGQISAIRANIVNLPAVVVLAKLYMVS